METKRRFDPWVGSHYHEGVNGKKVMVMGHVHVCDGCHSCELSNNPGQCSDFTSGAVEDYLKWRKGLIPRPEYNWVQTYLNFSTAFLGNSPDVEDEFENLWDRILFYNFVQVSVENWNVPPTVQDYLDSQQPFIDLLDEFQPDCIIAWGNGAYNYTPDNGINLDELSLNSITAPVYQYSLKSGKKCKMIKIHHPSMYFSQEKWHQMILKFLSS